MSEERGFNNARKYGVELQWLNQKEYKGRGRPKKYDGKVDIHTEKNRFNHVGAFENKTQIYSQILYSKKFKRNIQVILLQWEYKGKDLLFFNL